MHLYRSNRVEELVAALSSVLERSVSPPVGRQPQTRPAAVFETDTIVVASKAMERWLTLKLSERFGVWTSARFPFPRAMVEQALDAVLGVPSAPPPTRESLTWTIAALLPGLCDQRSFATVARYLEEGDGAARCFELAARIAYVFDQYAVYRPEMLSEWEKGAAPQNETAWQAELWRALVACRGREHFAARTARFLEAWAKADSLPEGLPSRLCVFGVSTLPPVYLRVFAALGQRVELHMFHLAASRNASADADLGDSGARGLLASLGKLGVEFERALSELGAVTEVDQFVEPGQRTMLATLQADLLALRRRGTTGAELPPSPAFEDDESIVVHACHSPMREVEVLRDQLLAAFDADPGLRPHEVVVMMPDVDGYAPLIDAVFGLEPNEPGIIAYRIAGRPLLSDNALGRALLALLDVMDGRMKASEVLDLLELPPVRRRFDLEPEALPILQRLAHEAGVRWGVDREHRKKLGQPARDEYTWRFGLDRLLLGYAMPGEDRRLFEGVLPFDDVEGDAAELIGRLAELAETLFVWCERLSAPRPPAQWGEALVAMLDALTAVDASDAWQDRVVRETIANLVAEAAAAGYDGPIDLPVVRRLLGEALSAERTSHDFVTGAVTFASLLPLRGAPFRRVYLLGMNHDVFPRVDRAPSFDLSAAHPRAGDRSVRNEDRALFLEALLSARDCLSISYVGRSVQDNAVLPPSVVVSELLDVIDRAFVARPPNRRQLGLPFAVEPGQSARRAATANETSSSKRAPPGANGPPRRLRDRLLVSHALQPFSRRYFDGSDPRLFSYSESDAEGARSLAAPRTAPPRFQRAPLAPPERRRTLSLDELARFLENPSRSLARSQLGLELDDEPALGADHEPFELEPLIGYALGSLLLEHAMRGEDLRPALAALTRRAGLPVGALGQTAARTLLACAKKLADASAPCSREPLLPPLEVELAVGDSTLTGLLRDVRPRAQLFTSFSKLRAKRELSWWVRHLALQCAAPKEHPRVTLLVGRNADGDAVRIRRYCPLEPDAARTELAQLVELFWLGQRAPLCLFPDASMTFAVEVVKWGPEGRDKALERAKSALFSARTHSDHRYAARLFAGVDVFAQSPVPFDDDGDLGLPGFMSLAARVFGPLLAHSQIEDR